VLRHRRTPWSARQRLWSVGAITAPAYLVLDLGHGPTPHQARCRRCRWRSGWRATAVEAFTEHDQHQAVAHLKVRAR
jgi:hypothetical protein